MKIDFSKFNKVHFIGIGGIGVSAIARMMMLEGKKVSGSDRNKSEITDELEKLGAKVFIGQKKENIQEGTELVIYTIAITDDNPELAQAREKNIPRITYPEALGIISKGKYTIAISGAHGKTTTTAMVAKVLKDAGLDPTVVVGSMMKEGDSWTNFIAGKGKYLVIEACEYRRSFLNYSPTILAITNIDDDHLDYYKDIEDIKNAFGEFVAKVPEKGYLVCNFEQPHIPSVAVKAKCNVVDYELFEDLNLKLKIPGEHNIANAGIALAIADILKIPRKQAEKSLEEFAGTWRRSEFKGKFGAGATLYDDYGHHPTEVDATLKGFREMFTGKRITVVFQPHLYSRTKQHLKHFGKVFADADNIIFAPIYPAREPFDATISSEMLADEVRRAGRNAIALPDFKSIENHIKENSSSKEDVVITMGAGDVYKIGENLIGKK